MIGLIFLAVFGSLFAGYSWLSYRGVRSVYRKTNSRILAGIAAIVFFLIPTGDTIFNRWYHQNVLCKRGDVGLKIFRKVQLPSEYYGPDGYLTKERKNKMFVTEKKVLGRYEWKKDFKTGGFFTFTGYIKDINSVVDAETGDVISQLIDYRNSGGGWWMALLEPIVKLFTYNGMGFAIGGDISCFAGMSASSHRVSDVLFKPFEKN